MNNRTIQISLLVLAGLFVFFIVLQDTDLSREIPYSTFISYLENGKVRSVKILDGLTIRGEFKGGPEGIGTFRTIIPYNDEDLMPRLREQAVSVQGGTRAVSPLRVLFDILPWLVGFFFIWFMFSFVTVIPTVSPKSGYSLLSSLSLPSVLVAFL